MNPAQTTLVPAREGRAGLALDGLTLAEVRERAAAGQVNAVPAAPGRSLGQILRANLCTRVIANIERVARLFVTKTVYAAVLAVAIGIAGDTFPFFPRHLTIVSTLAIGIPGFFLALSAGAPRAQAGFTRRVLTFAIPGLSHPGGQ